MRMTNLGCLVIAVSLLMLLNGVSGQEVTKKQGAVEGTWAWKHKGDAKTTDCELAIVKKDGKLHCRFKAGKKTYQSDSGSVKDGTFSVVFPLKGENKQYAFKGKVSNNKMTGTYQVPSSGAKDVKWSAKKTVSLEEVAGQWQLYFETPDGQSVEPVLSIEVEDGKPKVDFSSDGPELDISEIKFGQGVLTVKADIDFQGQAILIEYELEFKKKDVDGVIYFELKATGDQGEIEVEGERIK